MLKRRNILGKKMLSILLASVMAASIVACGSSSSSSSDSTDTAEETTEETAAEETTEETAEEATAEAPTADTSRTTTADSDERYDKVTVALLTDPTDLSPENINGDNSLQYVMQNFYEKLFDYRDNDYVGILAKGYTEVDDLHWDVEIYDYIYDCEGNHITAEDVVFSYQITIDAGKAMSFDYFESIEVVDDYTVEFTWTQPIDAIGALEWPFCRINIVSQAAYESGNMTDTPVGTGPYTVTEYVSGAYLTMEANDDYWQTDELRDYQHLANVQTIEYDIIAETSQHVIALSTGQIDYSEYVPTENIADFEDGGQYADGVDVYTTMGSGLYVLMANNMDGKATADVNLRKAIFYALDNEAIATAAGSCIGSSAFGTTFFSDYLESWESQDGNYMNTYDPDLAAEYLAESSYNGETLTIMGTSSEIQKNIMTMIQALLLQIGINVEIVSEEETLVQTDMLDSDAWDLLITLAGGGYQIGEWNRVVNNQEFGTGYNMAFIADDTLQDYLVTCKTVDGHTDENLEEAHQYILDNAYYHAICSPQMNACYNEDFATLVYRESEFLLPGACDYYLD